MHDKIHWNKFSLGSTSKNLTKDEQKEELLSGTGYDFSVHHTSIEKENTLHLHKSLMVKNNVKQRLDLMKKCSLNYSA